MTAVSMRRKRAPLPIPEDACRILGILTADIPDALGLLRTITFRLKRRKYGVMVWVTIAFGKGAFSWDLAHSENVKLASFGEARRWVAIVSARYGQTFVEKTTLSPQPRGADRALLRAGGCKESWLRSDIPQLFGEAAVRCQHPGGFCVQDGYCHYGDCDMEMEERAVEPDDEE